MENKRKGDIPISLRLEPRKRYLLELLARTQMRTMTGVIENALVEQAKKIDLNGDKVGESGSNNRSIYDQIENLWSPSDPDRIANLALMAPHILKPEERNIWEVILNDESLWTSPDKVNTWDGLHRNRLYERWKEIKERAEKGDYRETQKIDLNPSV